MRDIKWSAGVLLLCAALLAACNVKPIEVADEVPLQEVTQEVSTEEAIVTEEATVEADATPEAEETEIPTSGGFNGTIPVVNNPSSGGTNPVPANLPPCVPQHPEWPRYQVQTGDTLGSIASRVNSTVTTLASVNCLSNPNVIQVGSWLRVPQLPPTTPTIPIIGVPTLPANVCAVVPNGTQAAVWGGGDGSSTPLAYLQGKVPLSELADNAYIVNIPSLGMSGWISAMEAHLEGTPCPNQTDPLPMVGNDGVITDTGGCYVVRVADTVYIYSGWVNPHSPFARLGIALPYIASVNNGYRVTVAEFNREGWIPADGVRLEGNGCNLPPNQLPVVGYQGQAPAAGCHVVRDLGVDYVNIYYGAADVYAPIAVLADYADYVQHGNGGYEARVPQYERNIWIRAEGVHREGTGCPGIVPPQVTCLSVENGVGRPVITPSTSESGTCSRLTAGTVMVTWPQAPADFEMLEFWRMNGSGVTDVIGTDSNSADGASITWQVYEGMPPSVIYVFVYGGSASGNSGQLAVYINPA